MGSRAVARTLSALPVRKDLLFIDNRQLAGARDARIRWSGGRRRPPSQVAPIRRRAVGGAASPEEVSSPHSREERRRKDQNDALESFEQFVVPALQTLYVNVPVAFFARASLCAPSLAVVVMSAPLR